MTHWHPLSAEGQPLNTLLTSYSTSVTVDSHNATRTWQSNKPSTDAKRSLRSSSWCVRRHVRSLSFKATKARCLQCKLHNFCVIYVPLPYYLAGCNAHVTHFKTPISCTVSILNILIFMLFMVIFFRWLCLPTISYLSAYWPSSWSWPDQTWWASSIQMGYPQSAPFSP